MTELLYKEEVYSLIGAAMEVYNEMGFGFVEPVYQEALEMELSTRQIPFAVKREVCLYYKGSLLDRRYVPDMIVSEGILVELKALAHLTSIEEAELLDYLKATGLELGLLINFGCRDQLEWKSILDPESNQ